MNKAPYKRVAESPLTNVFNISVFILVFFLVFLGEIIFFYSNNLRERTLHIWNELSIFGMNSPYMEWNSPYME